MSRPGRGAGFVRQWKFLLALDARRDGLTLAEAAAAAAVSERTIRRDIDVLIWSGFPVNASTKTGVTRFTLRCGEWRGGDATIFSKGLQ